MPPPTLVPALVPLVGAPLLVAAGLAVVPPVLVLLPIAPALVLPPIAPALVLPPIAPVPPGAALPIPFANAIEGSATQERAMQMHVARIDALEQDDVMTRSPC
jgi:hypothetical protein